MFQNSYQNGVCFQIFDSKSPPDKTKNLFKMQNVSANNKVFDKELKTFIYEFQHPNSKIIIPKEDKKQLYLIQQYLNLQIQFGSLSDWNIELTVSDLTKIKRRIILSPSVNKTEKKPFFVKCAAPQIKQGVWNNFCINLYSFIEAFKGQNYRSLDLVQITGNFKLRKIFTTQNQFGDSHDQSSQSLIMLPKTLCFPPQIQCESVYAQFLDVFHTEQSIQNSDATTIKGSINPKSNKNIKKQLPVPVSNVKSLKAIEKAEKAAQVKVQQTETKLKAYKNEKKFLANTNGLERRKKELDSNSEASKQDSKSFVTPANTDKNIKKRQQPLNKTQIPKARTSVQKKSSFKEKQEQKMNPWKSSLKKASSIGGRYQSNSANIKKIESTQTSIFKTDHNLNLYETKGKSFDRRSDCHSDSDYVELSQKFSTVTQGRFFKNQTVLGVNHQQQNQKQGHDEIQQNIEIESNSFYENSNKKNSNNKQNQIEINQKLISESINDSLDEITKKTQKKDPQLQMQNESFMNMSSRFGFGQKMMNKYMMQIQRPYSPPLGQRQQTQDHESTYQQPQQYKQVQVIYDPVFNCYYDHRTHTYYQLKN